MRAHRSALEFRVELTADEVAVLGQLDDLDQAIVWARSAEHETGARELLAVLVVELEAVPMALADLFLLVQVEGVAACLERARVGAEAHGPALVLHAALVRHQIDDRIWTILQELGGGRALQPAHVASELDGRQLHAETDAEERHALLARVANRRDFPFDT